MGHFYEDLYEGGVPEEAHYRSIGGLGFGLSESIRNEPYSGTEFWRQGEAECRPEDINIPLLLVTGVALWPNSSTGFILAALAVLSWIRSGICFKHVPLRAFIAEVLTITGGAGYYILWRPDSPVTLALALWLFFLVQTLYFFIVPIVPLPRIRETANAAGGGSVDAFEQASQNMKRVLRHSPTT